MPVPDSSLPAPHRPIVIIDDDPGLVSMLVIALQSAGFRVQTATNGEEGLKLLELVQPALVISDIMMPQMDGVEMFNQIKERLQDDGIPIIVMTALNRKAWFATLEDEGAAIVQKPFEVELLLRLIESLIA
ncbi:MAG: response regulator [Chloroflexaceae bacterium]|nr:response regulator [Chloroflexaceae bacterium]